MENKKINKSTAVWVSICFHPSFRNYPGVRLLTHRASVYLNAEETPKLCFPLAVSSAFPAAYFKASFTPWTLQRVYCKTFHFRHSIIVKWSLVWVLICIALMVNDVEDIF